MLLLPVKFQKKCGSAAEVFRKLIGMLAYAARCNAVQYNDESDDDFDLAVHIRHKNTKNNRKCKWVPRGSRRNGFV